MDLRQYAALPPAQRLSLLLGLLGGDSLADDLALHVAPFLARLEGGPGGSSSSCSGSSSETVDPQVALRQVRGSSGCLEQPW